MTAAARLRPTRSTIIFCADDAVQRFVEDEVWNISPYSVPKFVKTHRQLFVAAQSRFGRRRCADLTIREH